MRAKDPAVFQTLEFVFCLCHSPADYAGILTLHWSLRFGFVLGYSPADYAGILTLHWS